MNKARKRNISYKDWSRRNKTIIIHSNVIEHIENPKESTDILLELISEFSKIAEFQRVKPKLIFVE